MENQNGNLKSKKVSKSKVKKNFRKSDDDLFPNDDYNGSNWDDQNESEMQISISKKFLRNFNDDY
jgi:hypothetical protein